MRQNRGENEFDEAALGVSGNWLFERRGIRRL
jgi:hypothetical protein